MCWRSAINKITLLCAVLVFSIFAYTVAIADDITTILPTIDELHGGKEHWLSTVSAPEEDGDCKIYSGTYAYFAEAAEPLFDIPRKNVYSVNIRLHVCDSIKTAMTLYDRFSAVGAEAQKRAVAVGDAGVLYVVPSAKSALMGDYYLSSLFKYIVLQIHSDDGFVLMDIARMMDNRVNSYLSFGDAAIEQSGAITVVGARDGYREMVQAIAVTDSEAERIVLSGILYDQHNNRVPDVDLYVRETGSIARTNSRGEFVLSIGGGEGEELAMQRVLTIHKEDSAALPLESGVYLVNTRYKDGAIGADSWRITVGEDGRISGSSRKILDGVTSLITGQITDENISVAKDCGSSMLGACRQNFSADITTDGGTIAGDWAGTGGGGEWLLYKDSFSLQTGTLSVEDSNIIVSGERVKSGDNSSVLTLDFNSVNHDIDTVSVRLNVDVKLADVEKSVGEPILYFKPLASETALPVFSQPITVIDGAGSAYLDITDYYKSSVYKEFMLGLYGLENGAEASVTPKALEITSAAVDIKGMAEDAAEFKLLADSADTVSTIKAIERNGKPDIAFELDIALPGTVLQGVEIKSVGKESRTWNSYTGSIFPGVAVLSGNKVLNAEDGSVSYNLKQFRETLRLYIDKGSLSLDNVNNFVITLQIDGVMVEYTVPTE